jgi:hypothetical protein
MAASDAASLSAGSRADGLGEADYEGRTVGPGED